MGEEIIVKRFYSYEEIAELDGFEPDKGVTEENYEGMAGHYHLSEELKCCRLRDSGTLCKKPHNYGFVVSLKDGSYSILGNTCALKRFSKDSNVFLVASRYETERKRQEALDSVRKIFHEKESRLEKLSEVERYVYQIYKYVRNIVNSLPSACAREINNIARTGNPNIVVRVEHRDYYKDDDGKVKFERRQSRHTVGVVSSAILFNNVSFEEPLSQLRESIAKLKKLDSVDESMTEIQANRFSSRLMSVDQASDIYSKFHKMISDFMGQDLCLISALCSDPVDRKKSCKVFLESMTKPHGNNDASREVDRINRQVLEETGAYKVIYG